MSSFFQGLDLVLVCNFELDNLRLKSSSANTFGYPAASTQLLIAMFANVESICQNVVTQQLVVFAFRYLSDYLTNAKKYLFPNVIRLFFNDYLSSINSDCTIRSADVLLIVHYFKKTCRYLICL